MNNNIKVLKMDYNELYNKYESEINKSLFIRIVETKLLDLYAKGMLSGTVHTCVGQELIAAVVADFIEDKDFIVSNHRGHGHYLAITDDTEGLIAEILGKKEGVCGGIGGSQHLHKGNFYSNGIQGGMLPIAAGAALARSLNNNDNSLAVAFIGDGTLGEGIVYETLNICSKWELPIIIILENNGYAQSTSMKQTFSGNLQSRIEGFGIEFYQTDTWDVDDLYTTIKEGINTVRANRKPVFIEINTFRLNAHSKGDDNRFNKEIDDYYEKDVLNSCIANCAVVNKLKGKYERKIDKIINHLIENGLDCEYICTDSNKTYNNYVEYKKVEYAGEKKRSNVLLYEAIKKVFNDNPKTVLLGEDVEYLTEWTEKVYGGAFKVTGDLSLLFKGQIRNTPISEAAITGIGIGLSLNGYKSFVEIMFGDFITLIFDQLINHASKIVCMYGRKLELPLVIRTPMGGGRGYGPTHSQSLEKYLLGIPNINLVAINHRINLMNLMDSIQIAKEPIVLIENKILYSMFYPSDKLIGFEYFETVERFPTTIISPKNKILPDVTIVTYGMMLYEVEKTIVDLFINNEILCEVVSPTCISPLNISPVIESVKKTSKVIVVEEGSFVAAFGSEIACALLESQECKIDKFERIGNNTTIPSALNAEKGALPNCNTIKKAVLRMF